MANPPLLKLVFRFAFLNNTQRRRGPGCTTAISGIVAGQSV